MTPQTGKAEAPTCDHCGDVKQWHIDSRKTLGGYWRCAERRRATQRRKYARTTGLTYHWLLLRHRRNKALTRRRNREAA